MLIRRAYSVDYCVLPRLSSLDNLYAFVTFICCLVAYTY